MVGILVALGFAGCRWERASGSLDEEPPDCRRPSPGCECDFVGEELDCGEEVGRRGGLIECSRGTMRCEEDGRYGSCSSERHTFVEAPDPGGRRALALGSPDTCPPGFDTCDPYCNVTVDEPGGFDAGTGFVNTTAGLTLMGTLTPVCDSLSLTPSTTSVVLSGSSMTSLSASPITFTLTASPAGCIASPFATSWVVDRFDRAAISGTDDTNGQLTIAVPIAGSLTVTAFAAGKSASTNIDVAIRVLEAPTTDGAASPNFAASASQIAAFGTLAAPGAGSGASSATWLYPYPETYLPLLLPAPVAQYRFTRTGSDSTTAASAVKLSLRYPAGATPSSAAFNYSVVVEEANSVSCAANAAWCNFLDPQVTIPQTAWRYFEQSARGQDAEIVVQRLRAQSSGSPVLETESVLPIHFVDGQLKGTVFYHSYTSPQASNNGAVLSIQPGATSPTLAVYPSGTCTTCHSINDRGTRLIANGGRNSGGGYSYDISPRYDMTTAGPAPTILDSYTNNRFSFGGPWLDGTYYMTHGAGTEWHAPSGASGLYHVNNENSAVAVANFPTNVEGYTPRFSPDGTKVAFTFRGGSNLPCASTAVSPCSGSPRTMPAASNMTRLAVMDFGCASPPCTSASSGFSVSNARDVTPSFGDRVAWPTFSPDGRLIAYQRQLRSSRSILGWAASDVGSIAGAQAEIWLSNVPATGATSATPVRLNLLNGRDSGGTTYLPERARTIIDNTRPLYSFRMNRHEMSVVSGASGPAVFLTGVPAGTYDVRIDITSNGSRGSAQFRFSTNGGSSWSSTLTTGATVGLSGTGMTANFATGTYDNTTFYRARTGQVAIVGTPVTSNQDVRIRISTTGNRGTAQFQYSTNAGSSWSGSLTTDASVALGPTGLVATFTNINYESTSWRWGALVAHPHEAGAQYSLLQADSCSNNATMSDTMDARTNYYPSFAPGTVGGKAWLLFTSRRMYGNVAVQDGWDPEPNRSCSTGRSPTKKLWISAVDTDGSVGSDPSHPAFYLPGQELAAGNSDGYWVGSECTAVDGACDSDDDCCGGTGTGATHQCRVISTATFPPSKSCRARSSCAGEGQSCASASDCCTGLSCPSGGGLCYSEPPLLFEVQTYVREYEAECPSGTLPAWRFFEWQADVPADTRIEFFAQTRESASDPLEPLIPLPIGTATSSTAPSQWFRGPLPTSSVLSNAGLLSMQRMTVTMVFHPNDGGTVAPTLLNWRQIFDCLPGE